jgi:succinate-semialdehyde dehydrogenase/glutarate-semialdehyde dehydrogenase
MSLTESELLAKVPTQLYIAGQWVDGHGAQSIEVEDPSTGKTLATIANANEADGLAALTAAANTQESWARLLLVSVQKS